MSDLLKAAAERFKAGPDFGFIKDAVIQEKLDRLLAMKGASSDQSIADLRAKLDEMAAVMDERDAVKQAQLNAVPPPEIADLIHIHESAQQANARLVRLYADAKNQEEMARDAGDRAKAMEWLKKAQRLETAVQWTRGRMAETVTF